MRGISPDANPDDHEATAPTRRPQRQFGILAADRVDDDVGATAGDGLDPHLQVFTGVIEDRVRALRRAAASLSS